MNIDETHHKKSSEGEKGGTRSMTLINHNLPRAGSKYVKDDGNHVSACYSCTPLETLPPVLIYKSTVKDPKNTWIKPSWVKGLTTVMRQGGVRRADLDGLPGMRKVKGDHGGGLIHQKLSVLQGPLPKPCSRVKWDKNQKSN